MINTGLNIRTRSGNKVFKKVLPAVILLSLLYLPLNALGSTILADEASAAWQAYLAESPRDTHTKDFIALRMNSFIENLKMLQIRINRGSNPRGLEIQKIMNRLKRDYRMLEETIRNLRLLSKESHNAQTTDQQLLTTLDNIYRKSKSLNQNNWLE